MKKIALKLTTILMLIIVLGLMFSAFVAYKQNPQHIKGQDVIATFPSPSNTYILTTYLNNSGMTTDFAVLGRVQNTETGKSRNVYWKYHCTVSRVEWLNDTTVVLNDITLDVEKDMYINNDYDTRYLDFDEKVDAIIRRPQA